MKKIILPIFLILTLTSAISLQDMIAAFKKGDATALAQYFDNNVELTLNGNTNSYSKNKAETAIKEFFENAGVRGFDVIHKSESSGSQYFIGNLLCRSGSYRTTIYVKTKDGKQVIQEIRFEK